MLALSSAVLAQPVPAPGAAAQRATDIREIRGPRPIEDPWRIAIELGCAAALLAAGYGLWWWWRRRTAPAAPSALARALERLLAARSMLEPARAREFSIELSRIVREFIEAHYGLDAAHRTTDEFLHELVRTEGALEAQRGQLADFLAACDLAKFGGWRLSLEAMERLYATAHDFIAAAAAAAATATVPPPAGMAARRSAPSQGGYDSIPAP